MDYRDYRAGTELGALARDLVADLERVRPGLADAPSPAALQEQVASRVDVRLLEIYRDQSMDPDLQDEGARAQLRLYQREIDQILVPRYAALALARNAAERGPKRHSGYNRAAYTFLFFLLGIFIVWAPFIPVYEKWVPFALALLAPFISPLLPDLHGLAERRRHELRLLTLLVDMDQAGRALPSTPVLPALPPAREVPSS